jgi:WD40 repeat protein
MNTPKPGDPTKRDSDKRLLEYDERLAAGDLPALAASDELPQSIRDGIACLQLLERLRLSGCTREVLPPAQDETLSGRGQQPGLGDTVEIQQNGEAKSATLLGRFYIQKLIGEGGCGLVFLAHDPALQRAVAVKVPRPEALVTPELRQRFLREGRAAARLDHPNLVPVFDAGQIGAVCYLASAYCPGITLRQWLQQNAAPAPPRAAAALMARLADAMHYAHGNGICHRDLKPSNVLLQGPEDGARPDPRVAGGGSPLQDLESAVPKIIDFGLAKVIGGDPAGHKTRTGALFGTPHYMSPEQARGESSAVGPASDIHALGVILYELLTGRLPYTGDTDPDILRQVMTAAAVAPRRIFPQVPRDLETICLKCLEKEPERRYGSMADLSDDLQRFLEWRPVRARPVGWLGRTARRIRRHPRATAAAAAGGVLLVTLFGALARISVRDSARSADLTRALEEIDSQKANTAEQDWLARSLQYALQIRACVPLKNDGHDLALRDTLSTQFPAPGQQDVRGFEWHYLWSFGKIMTPQQPAAERAVAYSRNGETIASGAKDGVIELFDTRTCAHRAKLVGHKIALNRLHFLNNNTQLLSTAFDVSPDGKTFHGEYILWDLATGNRILRRGAFSHTNAALGHSVFAPAPDGRVLFVIDRAETWDRIMKIHLDTGTEQELLRVPCAGMVACTPDGSRLIVVQLTYDPASALGSRSVVLVVDPVTGRELAAHEIAGIVHLAEISPDGTTLAVGRGVSLGGKCVEIRQFPTFDRLHSLHFEKLPVSIRFDWQGARLSVMDSSVNTYLFDVLSGMSLRAVEPEHFTVVPTAFSPDGNEMAGATGQGIVRAGLNLFAPEGYSLPGPLPESEAWCVAFCPDGKTLAAGYDHEDGPRHDTLRLWDLAAKKSRSLAGHSATVMALAVSPDGKTLATASYDRTVRLWDMATGKCVRELQGHSDPVRAIAFSPDGLQLASGGNCFIKTWHVKDGAPLRSWFGHDALVRSLVYSRDGKLLISAGEDRKIMVWNAADGAFVRVIENEDSVQGIARSPDGRLLASGDEKNQVKLWHLATGTQSKALTGHTGKVRCVAFSRDGKTLASGGEDKVVRLWNVVTGQELLQLPTDAFVDGVAFDADSRVLAAALHNGTVRVWKGD